MIRQDHVNALQEAYKAVHNMVGAPPFLTLVLPPSIDDTLKDLLRQIRDMASMIVSKCPWCKTWVTPLKDADPERMTCPDCGRQSDLESWGLF